MAKGDWWLKLEIHTWLNDPKVRKLKRENRDTWLTACMLMTLDGSAELSGTPDELRNALHLTLTEFYDFVHDLENTNTADVTRCHAVSRNGLELVTLKSRRYARELSIKEKNRLRKQKERGHADVTPDSRDRVKSKELEVKEREENTEEENAPANQFRDEVLTGLRTELRLNILPKESEWIDQIEWAFVNQIPAADFLECFRLLRQQTWRKGRITAANVATNVVELEKLREAVRAERDNGRPPDVGKQTEPVINDLPDCMECDNQRWIYPEGDWRKAYKCPACSQEAIAA